MRKISNCFSNCLRQSKFLISNFVNNPLFSGSMIMVIGTNSISFINYLYHLVMGRMLGPVSYGELAAIISLAGLLGIIPGSLNLVVIKYISAAKNDKEKTVLINWLKTKILMISFVLSLIIFATSPVISSFLNINEIGYLLLVAISFLFSLQALLNRSILQGLLKFKEMVFSLLVEVSAKLLIGIWFVYLGFQVGGALTGFVISAAIGWYITNLYLKYRPLKNILAPSNIKQMVIFTVPVTIQSIAITSLYSSDVILVKHFFSSYDAGIYAALSTLGRIIFFGAGPISAVMFPLVSKRLARGGNYKRIFNYSLLATLVLTVVILFLYWQYPQLAIKMLFGTKYLEAAGLLVWFGIFISLFTLSSLLINYGLSLGKTSIVILPLIAAALQIIIIWFFHQSLYMVVLVSTGVSALLLLSLLIYSSYAKRFLI